MTPFLELALALAIIIFAAKAGGYLSLKLGQPSVLGELLVGILLGPTVIDLLHLPFFNNEQLPETIHEMAEIGVMLLMFIAGLELHIEDLAKAGKVASLAGVMGVIFPLGLGALVGIAGFKMEPSTAIFIGLVLSATSVSISAQTLMEMKVLRSRVGISMMGAAVFDDVLVVLALSVFTALSAPSGDSGGALGILIIFLRMALYLVIFALIGFYLFPRWTRKVGNLPVSQALISFSIVILLLYGWAAEVVGSMAAITGAFLAGLLLGRTNSRDRILAGFSVLAYGLFVPVFFVNVGLSANARDLTGDNLLLFLGMTFVAIVGKVLGAGFGAQLGGLTERESLQLGIGMMSRGEVGLIVASVGVNQGLIGEDIFAAAVGVVILTTLLTPPLLRLSFSKSEKGRKTETIEEPTKGENP